jgi:hypothetical protein
VIRLVRDQEIGVAPIPALPRGDRPIPNGLVKDLALVGLHPRDGAGRRSIGIVGTALRVRLPEPLDDLLERLGARTAGPDDEAGDGIVEVRDLCGGHVALLTQ